MLSAGNCGKFSDRFQIGNNHLLVCDNNACPIACRHTVSELYIGHMGHIFNPLICLSV